MGRVRRRHKYPKVPPRRPVILTGGRRRNGRILSPYRGRLNPNEGIEEAKQDRLGFVVA